MRKRELECEIYIYGKAHLDPWIKTFMDQEVEKNIKKGKKRER